ncbi:MAG: amino acid ABC transporter permease [Gammaproteobacteria bacterium]
MADFWLKFWEYLPQFLPILLWAALTTIQVTLGALALALTLGMGIALMRIARSRLLRWPALVYIDVLRGTPALVQLFILYFGLADLGIEFSPINAAILGLGINGAAYVAEIYRAGIEAIQRGQWEAALALGLTPVNTMRYIVLPQALRLMLPPLGNYAIGLLKDTAIISAIAAPEVMFEARRLVQATFLSNQIYLLCAAIYLALTVPLSRLVRRLEKAKDAWR